MRIFEVYWKFDLSKIFSSHFLLPKIELWKTTIEEQDPSVEKTRSWNTVKSLLRPAGTNFSKPSILRVEFKGGHYLRAGSIDQNLTNSRKSYLFT